jgi:hypothetical protein
MARSTAYRYKGREGNAQRVGKALSVRSVPDGTYCAPRRGLGSQGGATASGRGSRLAALGSQFGRQRGDVLTLEDEIARKISTTLEPRLTGEQPEQLVRRPTADHEACHLYLKRRYLWNRLNDPSLKRAITSSRNLFRRTPC